jgi:AmiR/NasT family two-component response regulator
MVKELRHHCSGAYILAFVDPDQHSRLHQAIEDGIDNFIFKSLQREDVFQGRYEAFNR